VSVPAVSVIVNFLDQKAFIRESLDSALAQTFQDWELLLIDDGSTDGSTEIAQQYARAFPGKIKYFEHAGHENRGRSASANVGLRAARAAYVAFLDADDVWLPCKLQEQVSLLDSCPDAVMLYGDTPYWYSWTGRDEDAHRDKCVSAGLPPNTLVDPPTLFVRMLRQEIPVPSLPDALLRRHLALEVGGFEESFRRIFTDQVFYSKLCLRWPVLVAAGKQWFKYRIHQNSSVAVVKAAGQLQTARLAYLNWLAAYVREHGFGHAIQKEVRVARWKCAYPRLWNVACRTAIPAAESIRAMARRTRANKAGDDTTPQ
jgi:glycosyltransferase involved in cell wall biosynthesis